MYPPVTYITDCTDANARARLSTRVATLFGLSPVILPIDGSCPEQFAGLTLLDMLRSTELLGEAGLPTITLLNIAPRDGRWPNGAPFCFFWHGRHLVVCTFSAPTLSLVRRYLGVARVHVTDVRTVIEAAADTWADFDSSQVEMIVKTQFRSLWYLPLLARWIIDRRPVPAELQEVPTEDSDMVVSVVDNFGNCKLNCTGSAIGFAPGSTMKVMCYRQGLADGVRPAKCYSRLSEVPIGQAGVVIGSSGVDFVEIVVGQGSAATEFGLREGLRPFA